MWDIFTCLAHMHMKTSKTSFVLSSTTPNHNKVKNILRTCKQIIMNCSRFYTWVLCIKAWCIHIFFQFTRSCDSFCKAKKWENLTNMREMSLQRNQFWYRLQITSWAKLIFFTQMKKTQKKCLRLFKNHKLVYNFILCMCIPVPLKLLQ